MFYKFSHSPKLPTAKAIRGIRKFYMIYMFYMDIKKSFVIT